MCKSKIISVQVAWCLWGLHLWCEVDQSTSLASALDSWRPGMHHWKDPPENSQPCNVGIGSFATNQPSKIVFSCSCFALLQGGSGGITVCGRWHLRFLHNCDSNRLHSDLHIAAFSAPGSRGGSYQGNGSRGGARGVAMVTVSDVPWAQGRWLVLTLFAVALRAHTERTKIEMTKCIIFKISSITFLSQKRNEQTNKFFSVDEKLQAANHCLFGTATKD